MGNYEWAVGSRFTLDPNIVGKACEELESNGNLNAASLVDMSRPEDSPTHPLFEWDDSVAAEEYRKTQAGKAIRALVTVEIKEAPSIARIYPKVRAYASVAPNVYEGTIKVLQDSEKRGRILEQAKKDLKIFENKYHMLLELADVFTAIKKVVD